MGPALLLLQNIITWLVAYQSGGTAVFGAQTFPV